MSQVVGSAVGGWTAVDLVERFGAIPLNRVRQEPVPGSATEQDVIEIREHEDRLYELVDGTLVEKTVGVYESYSGRPLAPCSLGFRDEEQPGHCPGTGWHDAACPGAGADSRRFVHFLAEVCPAAGCPASRSPT